MQIGIPRTHNDIPVAENKLGLLQS